MLIAAHDGGITETRCAEYIPGLTQWITYRPIVHGQPNIITAYLELIPGGWAGTVYRCINLLDRQDDIDINVYRSNIPP